MLAVAVTLAIPEALVVAVSDDSVAFAPTPAQRTSPRTPETGCSEPSRTVTCSAVPKAVDTTVDLRRAARRDDAAERPAVLVRLKRSQVSRRPPRARDAYRCRWWHWRSP